MRILYEDNHLLVVVKPPNLPVQADASGDEDLLSQCKRYIGETYHKPGEVYLGLVHRLDRPAGGVLVFARTSKAAARLSAQFRGHGTQKRYAVLVTGTPKPRAQLTDYVLREESTTRVADANTAGAQEARLRYARMETREGVSLLDVELYTGRHHQIRVQLAHAGLPVWGDQRYAPGARPGQQLALWAYALTLEHPTLHTRLTFTAMPEGGAWTPFARQLAAMAQGFSIAYENDTLLCARKGVGMETCAEDADADDREEADTLLARARRALGTAVYPVHRLDVNTTGLVLFAKTPEAQADLQSAIQKRAIRKFYRCLVKGVPAPREARLRAWLIKDENAARVRILDAPTPEAKPIETAYRVLRAGDPCELEVELLTGRTHQIRAHLAHIGHPLLGDDKYGEREWNRQHKASLPKLCAVRLELPDSVVPGGMVVETTPPWEE